MIDERGGWQVLIHPRNAPRYTARAGEGRLSLLLWHPRARISILVPSVESAFAYEIAVPGAPLGRSRCYTAISRVLRDVHGVAPLPPPVLTDLYARYVLMALVGATVPAA